ncbi:conserved hypothetical protein [Pelagirhabdus alkalitolerans]|uniref:Phosphatidylglycerol lysyltransferase n=1 Tax=Pelagirhabdus alkalitolerans TaxID=1612202 RepID=A0A1G6GPU6_9BACI|nr:lysylphosphatidylglycerol synthase transmembrane domain-containing protein [Pelagirhabdus alkalitolerans]SDB83978.1 conserved hypothetical protein [Pelagirhabdus alkalitolerans]
MLKRKIVIYSVLILSTFYVFRSMTLPSDYPVKHLTVMAGLQLLTIILLAWQNKMIIQKQNVSFRYFQSLHMQLLGTFFDVITPMMKVGGEVVKMRYIETITQSTKSRCLSMILIGKSLSLVSLTFLMFLFGYELMSHVTIGRLVGLFILIATVVFVCLKSEKVRGFAIEAQEQLVKLGGFILIRLLTINSFVWLLFPLKLWILGLHYDLSISYIQLIGITLFSYFAGNLPITPGGMGTFEAALVFGLTSHGTNYSTAIEMALLFRFITYYGVFIVSGLYLASMEVIKWFINTWQTASPS